jgi:hypothetical protein
MKQMIGRQRWQQWAWTVLPFLVAFSTNATEVVKKATAEYHMMCGCKHIFYIDKFEGVSSAYDHFTAPGGTVEESIDNSSELPGSSTCTRVTTAVGAPADLVFSNDDVSCFMKGHYSWLSGYYKTEKGRYAAITAQYQLDNDGTWHDMETIHKIGVPFWTKFDYYLDFSGLGNVTDVRLRVASPDAATPVSIDEIRICNYCLGVFTDPPPELLTLEPSMGTLDRPFNGSESSYLLTVAPSVTSIKLKPVLVPSLRSDPNVTIRVNDGDPITSGTNSQVVTIAEGTEIWVEIKKSACERMYYVLTVHYLESPDNDATLSALGVSDGKLKPQFHRYTTQYAVVDMPYGVTSMTVTPLATNKDATIKVNGEDVDNGSGYQIEDIVATPEILIEVTAGDGVTKRTYRLTLVPNLPTVFFTAASQSGMENVTSPNPPITVRISPAPATGKSVTVLVRATGGTASGEGVDYTIATASLTFSSSQTTRTIGLSVINDLVWNEPDETIELALVNPTGGALLGAQKTFVYRILDNDIDNAPPTVRITSPVATSTYQTSVPGVSISGTASDNVGLSASLYYELTGASQGSGTVSISAGGVWALPSLNLNPGATNVAVAILDVAGNLGTARLSILYQRPTVSFSSSSGSGDESVAQPQITVTVTPDLLAGQVVQVNCVAGGGSATLGADYTYATTTLYFDANHNARTVPLAITDDNAPREGDETVRLALENPVGAELGSIPSFTYTIHDNDFDQQAPVVAIASPSTSGRFVTYDPVLSISGTATDAGGVAGVTYQLAGATAGNGTANGTTSWSIQNLRVKSGSTFVTIRATDGGGSVGVATIEIVLNVVFVDSKLSTGADDGTDWANAYRSVSNGVDPLQRAIDNAIGRSPTFDERVQVFVAKSSANSPYVPLRGIDNGEIRTRTFTVPPHVDLFGGFAGGGDERYSDRNWVTNPVVLSGDLNGDGQSIGNAYHVVRASVFEHSVGGAGCTIIDGFTISGGNCADLTSASSNDANGGCGGGGVLADFGAIGSVSVLNCQLLGNTARRGGGIYGPASRIVNCRFDGNSAREDVAYWNADRTGGAADLFSINAGEWLVIEKCTFTNNSADDLGGALNTSATIYSNVRISGCVFSSNTTGNSSHPGQGGLGGAAFLGNWDYLWDGTREFSGGTVLVENCVFYGNSGIDYFSQGGALYLANHNPNMFLRNSSFGHNHIGGAGNSVQIGGEHTQPSFSNCIFWGGSGAQSQIVYPHDDPLGNNKPIITSSCIHDGFAEYSGNGNIFSDPLFSIPNLVPGCSRNSAGCTIDHGTSTNTPTTDINGVQRPVGGGYDMGAYEQ